MHFLHILDKPGMPACDSALKLSAYHGNQEPGIPLCSQRTFLVPFLHNELKRRTAQNFIQNFSCTKTIRGLVFRPANQPDRGTPGAAGHTPQPRILHLGLCHSTHLSEEAHIDTHNIPQPQTSVALDAATTRCSILPHTKLKQSTF